MDLGGSTDRAYGGANHIHPRNWHKRNLKTIAVHQEGVFIFVCVIQAIAVLTTVFRLVHRWLRHKLWWDDCCAAVAIVGDGILFITFLIAPIQRQSKPPKLDARLILAISWTTVISYTIALWAARMTMAVTITRLLPAGPVKFLSKLVSWIFAAFGLALVIHKIYFCSQAGCFVIPAYTGIIELVMDISADVWLLFAPVYMLFQMKLRPSHHRLILGIFTCGIFTSMASISHIIFILLKWPNWIAITSHIQVMIAIVVSNLLILVTVAYRYIQQFRRHLREVRNISDPSTSRHESTTETMEREGDRETGPAPSDNHESSQFHVDLTEISSPHRTERSGRVSFLSSAPFSSFLDSSSFRHDESVKSYLHEFKSEKIHEEPALNVPEHEEVESKLEPEWGSAVQRI